jgi:hypothetical protein
MSRVQETVRLRKEYYEKLNELKVREKEAGRMLLKGHNDINDAEWLINENEFLRQENQELKQALYDRDCMEVWGHKLPMED